MGEPMDRSKRVFGDLAPFEKVFPTIDVATISSWKDGEGYTRSADESLRRSFGTGVPFKHGLERCRNPRCKNGGYEIDQSLDQMVRGNLTEKEFETR